jgi:HKD family nuclease
MTHPQLHAKAYLRLDREGRNEAIITSANLTRAGLESNVELGVHASSTSLTGRQLVAKVRHFLDHLALHEARSSSSYPNE